MRFKNTEELKSLLDGMKSADIHMISLDDADELKTIKIRKKQPPDSRVRSYLKQVKNPYVHRIGDVIVKVSFSDSDRTLQDCMEEYLKSEILIKQ